MTLDNDAPAQGTYLDGRTARGDPAWITLAPASIVITGADGARLADWPRSGVVRTDAYADSSTGPDSATFRCGRGSARLHITDAATLAQLRAAGILKPRAAGWSARVWAGIAGGIAVALVVAGVLVDQLPALLVPFVPRSAERYWSSAIQAAVSTGSKFCVSPRGDAALAVLMQRLSSAAGVVPTPPFYVLDTPLINAFTLPDGRIIILRGLIDKAQDPDELAGVLAHELGHVHRRDPTREMLRGMELNMLARSLGWGGNLAGQMAALSYGRKAEAAADASALRTLRAAHLRADGLSRFFTLLLGTHRGDGFPGFLSDHPTTSSRAEALRVGHEGEAAMDAASWAAVRGICVDK